MSVKVVTYASKFCSLIGSYEILNSSSYTTFIFLIGYSHQHKTASQHPATACITRKRPASSGHLKLGVHGAAPPVLLAVNATAWGRGPQTSTVWSTMNTGTETDNYFLVCSSQGLISHGQSLTICGSWILARLWIKDWLKLANSCRRDSFCCSITLFSSSIVFRFVSIVVI